MENNMKERPYPYKPKNPRPNTKFEQKWGISAIDLAQEEGVTSDAIQMRVMRFGTPFQRKKLPTLCEVMTGKTVIQIAHETGVTPITISQRLKKYGDAYYEPDHSVGIATRGTTRAENHWTKTKHAGRNPGCKTGWLSPRHPEFYSWRYYYVQTHCPTAKDTLENNDE
jgi:hypothetical protein